MKLECIPSSAFFSVYATIDCDFPYLISGRRLGFNRTVQFPNSFTACLNQCDRVTCEADASDYDDLPEKA
jgi:hypothetical protein